MLNGSINLYWFKVDEKVQTKMRREMKNESH